MIIKMQTKIVKQHDSYYVLIPAPVREHIKMKKEQLTEFVIDGDELTSLNFLGSSELIEE